MTTKLSTPRPRSGRRRIQPQSPLLWPAGRGGAAWLATDAEGRVSMLDPGLGYWSGAAEPEAVLGTPLDALFDAAAPLLEGSPRLRAAPPAHATGSETLAHARIGYVDGMTLYEFVPDFLESPHAPEWVVERALDELALLRESSAFDFADARARLTHAIEAISDRAMLGVLTRSSTGFLWDDASPPEFGEHAWTAPAELVSTLTSIGSVTVDARAVPCLADAAAGAPERVRALFDPARLWRALDLPVSMVSFEPVFLSGELAAVLALGSPDLAIATWTQRRWLQRAATLWAQVIAAVDETRPRPLVRTRRPADLDAELKRERRIRIDAEAALRYRERLMEAIGHTAEQLLAEPGSGRGLDDLVRRFGETVGASRACLYANEGPSEGLRAVRQHRWFRPHAEIPQLVLDEPASWPWDMPGVVRWRERLSEGDLLHGPAETFPEPERTLLQTVGVASLCVVPIFVDGEWWGYLCVDDFDRPRTWSSIELDALRIGAQMVGSAILHRREREHLETESATRDALLREVNHRVKNNLATIIGMLYAARRHADDARRRESLFSDLVARVEGLAAVHTLLSESSWRPLPLGKLCLAVCEATIRGSTLAVTPTVALAGDPDAAAISIDSARAHHLALIVNELTTNVAKHAELLRGPGAIQIALAQVGDQVQLVFRDDGPGFPAELLSGDEAGNVGFELVENVVRRNLRGAVRKWNDGGAVVELTFPVTGDE